MFEVLPAQHPPRRRYGLVVQRREVVHWLGWLRPALGVLAAADGAEHGDRGAVPIILCRNHVRRADGRASAAAGTGGVPGGGRVPVDEQGLEPPVLAVAGGAGGGGGGRTPASSWG